MTCLTATLPATPYLSRRMARLGFLTLTAAFGLNFAAGQFFAPLDEDHGWGLGVLSAAAALNAAVSGVVQPSLGRLIDRIGARAVIATCLALMGTAYVLMASAAAAWLWVVAYGVVAGIGFAGCSTLAVTVLISHWHTRDRARVLSRVFLGINAGQLTLVPLGGLLIERAGYRTAYLVLGLLVLAVAAPVIAVRTVSRPAGAAPRTDNGADRRAGLGVALRSRWFWLATLAFGINGWTLYFALLHLPRYARDLGGSLAAGGTLLAVAAAASGLGMLASSRLAGRWGRRRVVMALFWWRAAVLVVAALATTSGQLVVVAAAFGAASFPVIPLVMSLISDRYGTNVLGGVLGVVFASHQVFAGLGVFAGGLLRASTGSYDAPLLIAAALLVLGSGLLLVLDDAHAPSSSPLASAPLREPTIKGRITP